MKARAVITYKHYFDEFFRAQQPKVRDKIIKILDIIEAGGQDSIQLSEIYGGYQRTF